MSNNQTKGAHRLGEESIGKLLWSLSVPGVVGMATQALYNIVDSIFVGRYSSEGLTAVSAAFPMQMIIIAIAVGTGIGATSLISRYLGQGNKQDAKLAAEHTLILCFVYGVLTALLGFFLAKPMAHFFVDDPRIASQAADYLRIIFVGSIGLYFPVCSNNILRGQGNTFYPMLVLLLGAGLNILFDPFLIFGLGPFPTLGVKGAAYATILAKFISGLFLVYLLFQRENDIIPDFRGYHFSPRILWELYQVGLPTIAFQLLGSIAVAGMNKLVGSIEPLAIAAVGVYFRLQSFIMMPIAGLNQGLTPIVGYNYGKQDQKRVKEAIWKATVAALVIATAGFLAFQLFPRQLLQLFNSDEALVGIGVPALRRMTLAMHFVGLFMIISATFQAVGRGLPSLVLSLLRQVIFVLPLMAYLLSHHSLAACWYAVPIADTLATIVAILWIAVSARKWNLSSERD